MIPLPNQPIDFGYSDTCDCNDSDYTQFYSTQDRIQVAFKIEPCPGVEPIELGFQSNTCYDGAVREDFSPGVLAGAGLYQITFDVPSYTSGSVEVAFGGTVIGVINSAGQQTFYYDHPGGTPDMGFFSTNFVGCIRFTITFQILPTSQQAFIVDSNGDIIDEMNRFRRGDMLVFEFNAADYPPSTFTDSCTYRIGWTNECNPYGGNNPVFFSGSFVFVESPADCNVLLSGCYPGSQFGWPEDFSPSVRLSGRLKHPQYRGAIVKSIDSAGYETINFIDRIKTMVLAIDPIPEHITDFLSVWVGFEQMYINNESWRIVDPQFPEITYLDAGSDLGQLEIEVRRVRQLVKSTRCGNQIAPCEEIPPPPDQGPQKLFEDGDLFEFEDGQPFQFE
jgi:hypothetical protein